MNIGEVFLKFQESLIDSPRTYKQFKKSISEYIRLLGGNNKDFSVFQEKDNLERFIFRKDGVTCITKYSALNSMYKFYETKILNKNNQEFSFPIPRQEVENEDKRRKAIGEQLTKTRKEGSSSVVYLEPGFDFSELFNETYYEHLQNKSAIATVKCAIALALCAGYDSGHMFTKSKKGNITLDNCMVDNGYVIVKNFYSPSVETIKIGGKCAYYISDYITLRKEFEDESNTFFLTMWKEENIHTKTPLKTRNDQNLVLYMLKHISEKVGLRQSLHITHLRYNMVLHYLFYKKGSSLPRIIEIFDYPQFVQESFKKYRGIAQSSLDDIFDPFVGEETNDKTEDTDKDFFTHRSPENTGGQYLDGSSEDTIEFRKRILNERIRNTTKAKKIKVCYEYTCQICGEPFIMLDGIRYAETSHIQPHSKEHRGDDDYPNMIVLCPNHHKMFDLGVITIDPNNLNTILHINKKDKLHGAKIKLLKHELSSTSVRYHYEQIFLDLAHKLRYCL